MATTFKKGDRVRYTGKGGFSTQPNGTPGTVKEIRSPGNIFVAFDNGNSSGVLPESIELIPKVSPFLGTVVAAITDLFKPRGLNGKDEAVRAYGIAKALISKAEAEKKKAKNLLVGFGIIDDTARAPGKEVVYESNAYIVTADTKAGSSRIDPALLHKALDAEPALSSAGRRRILEAATVDIKPATSFRVDEK